MKRRREGCPEVFDVNRCLDQVRALDVTDEVVQQAAKILHRIGRSCVRAPEIYERGGLAFIAWRAGTMWTQVVIAPRGASIETSAEPDDELLVSLIERQSSTILREAAGVVREQALEATRDAAPKLARSENGISKRVEVRCRQCNKPRLVTIAYYNSNRSGQFFCDKACLNLFRADGG